VAQQCLCAAMRKFGQVQRMAIGMSNQSRQLQNRKTTSQACEIYFYL